MATATQQQNQQQQPATTAQARPPDEDLFVWHADAPPRSNYEALGKRLASRPDCWFFRQPAPQGGLIQLRSPAYSPVLLLSGRQLLPHLLDTLNVVVAKDNKFTGRPIPQTHLDALLHSSIFLRHFHPVSQVTPIPRYVPSFDLTARGYNRITSDDAIFYTGPEPYIASGTEAIRRFLDVMDFATAADRTNAIAAALTVMLRNFWPGGKPIILATATKSHAGKDTIIDFAVGLEKKVSISYQQTDWALERSFVGAFRPCPDAGVIVVENARLYGMGQKIASGFVERFATDPEPMLFSTGTGLPVRRTNDIIVAISTNFGDVSEDILNRSLPIHLTPTGDIHQRQSPIGNPKHEYLPAHREQIAAELRGLVEIWRRAGRPLDTAVRHPFTPWAQTVGGILLANGIQEFLANYGVRKTLDDPVREGLGILGSARPDQWLRTVEWTILVEQLGLVGRLVPVSDRESPESRQRRLGVVLSAHENETVIGENEDGTVTLRIEKSRRRWEAGQQPHTRYRFAVVTWSASPVQE